MAKAIELKATRRNLTGRSGAKRTRGSGKVPAVLYGHGNARPIELDRAEITKAVRFVDAESILVELEVSDEGKTSKHLALLKDLQVHPLKDNLVHVDFQELDKNKKMHAEVVVNAVGEPAGVKLGGILEHTLRHLHVECLPLDLPESIEIDVSKLELDQALHVSEIAAPKGVTILNHPELQVFAVHAPKAEEEPAPAAAGAAATAAEPEVIKKEKAEKPEEK
jgi:large subunit ribosomal protein L25